MADNTQLNSASSSGDTIRTLQKSVNGGTKTEVVQLDVGGGDAGNEVLVSATSPMPVTVVSIDILEQILLELRVISSLLAMQSDPVQTDPAQLRSDPTLVQ